jgi:hypothetical protein
MTEQQRGDGLATPIPHFVYDTRGWKVADAVDGAVERAGPEELTDLLMQLRDVHGRTDSG